MAKITNEETLKHLKLIDPHIVITNETHSAGLVEFIDNILMKNR